MIEVKNASFAYDKANFIFEDINFKVKEGKILGVMGTNGIGKTTLLKCIAGIFHLTSGECIIRDTGNGNYNGISYVPQAKKINFSYSVLDFVSFGRAVVNSYFAKPSKEDYELSEEILKLIGISKLKEKSINSLSGGELQMCYIAKALVSDPKVLILDEPESNLDFNNQKKIINTLKTLSTKKNTTIILNTHFINHAAHLSDKCLLMGKKKYAFGDKDTILTEERLEEYFNVPIRKAKYNGNGTLKQVYTVLL